MFFSRCVSYAVKPAKTSTPITEMANCRPEEPRKMFTIEARMMPNTPMIRNEPMPDMSRFVV